MNSQEYNEMSLQFKEVYDKKEKEIKKIKKKYLEIYKLLTCIYGLSRCFLMYGNDSSYIEDVRGMTSSYLFSDMEESDSDDDLTNDTIEILNFNIPI